MAEISCFSPIFKGVNSILHHATLFLPMVFPLTAFQAAFRFILYLLPAVWSILVKF